MEKTYKAIVNDSFEFTMKQSEIDSLDSITQHNSKTHILKDNTSVAAEIVASDFHTRTYTIKVNGNRYTVSIESELDALIEEMGLSLGSDAVENEIHAPMPGVILEVNISEGDSVSEGDTLCVLEAMKMENALTASKNATVKAVHIANGDTVDKNALLIELED
ncbi:acetyl-CoA carboxylase biotin carboxyl carrier protein subunit [Luteirhabdus pelagi]|uniref:acetyl-CoA carboxylase biotin carboxyl carrier protein subunit n=1 Tax=Luteirhabdus pelagi TaxID=2792783 RepID=UPI001939D58F|nr:acetyl-CoA carboxylase biotin carboxyl carrier protein subunit [Luteirhabdus pelagi]